MTIFFLTLTQISEPLFFSPIFDNAIATIANFFFYSPISAMALPQLGCHKFFFSPYFGNAIAIISLLQFFFPPYFGNAIATIVKTIFFSLYFGNDIATIRVSQIIFFLPILAMPFPQLVCHKFF